MKVTAIADSVGAQLIGDPTVDVNNIASIQSASAGDLVFVEDAKNLRLALDSSASAVIAGNFAGAKSYSKPLLIAKQPRLAFAHAAKLLRGKTSRQSGIHPTAVLHSSANLAQSVTVGPRAVIEENVEIGEGTFVGAGCVIGGNTKIGKNCLLYPNVTIYPGVQIGNGVIIHAGAVLGSDGFGYARDESTGHYEKFPQVGRLEIDDDVEIGANSTIDRGALDTTRIRRGTKIDNLVHIGHNCQIGEDVIIAAQTGLSGSITIENNVVLGGQAGIGEHARIEEGVMLGGQGGVLPNKILRGKGIAFWGTPARPVREYLKQLAVLERLAKKE
ncbi:MAG TPA: UDP-3-O-(3-hydroxymyristoyl)glucosamine N-acyltransferase [Terriglobales bacterium]|jgi:UDP-3-O-[3-hydroxymyristoyl] glucosamine N-acyltransferase|nr:UDP-3-O-(3-hydroxymyristoyl)glucosamine N-acyltransferase [Terriglobales bacterium]